MKTYIIAAIGKNMVIGSNGKIPWHLPEDLKRFKEMTKGKIVVMGRKTYESINGHLPERLNIVITSQKKYNAPECLLCPDIETVLYFAKQDKNSEVFFIGGESIFKEALKIADKMFLTFINQDFEGDAFFPNFNPNEWEQTGCEKGKTDDENSYEYWFVTFSRKQNPSS